MTHDDELDEALVQQLCDADAAAPPPAGDAITPDRLARRQTWHARRRVASAAIALLIALPLVVATSLTIGHDRQPDQLHTDLGALESKFDDLLRQLQSPPIEAEPLSDTDQPDHRLRLQLAFARAGAVPVRTTDRPEIR